MKKVWATLVAATFLFGVLGTSFAAPQDKKAGAKMEKMDSKGGKKTVKTAVKKKAAAKKSAVKKAAVKKGAAKKDDKMGKKGKM